MFSLTFQQPPDGTNSLLNGRPDGNAITDRTHIGIVNPIRYKGYCYDTETGLYYLNSRYYDPEVCRFISADELLSTGQNLVGFNTFAYCLNNPANYSDTSGMRAGLNTMAVNDGGSSYPTPTKTPNNSIIDYITNTDEQIALNSGPISFYKGVPVIHLPFNVDPFSMGFIFLGNETSNRRDAIETIQHQYGHCLHLNMIGLPAYLDTVAAPSVIGYFCVEPNRYYSQPLTMLSGGYHEI